MCFCKISKQRKPKAVHSLPCSSEQPAQVLLKSCRCWVLPWKAIVFNSSQISNRHSNRRTQALEAKVSGHSDHWYLWLSASSFARVTTERSCFWKDLQIENAIIISWCYVASLTWTGQLKCHRKGLLDSVGKLKMSATCGLQFRQAGPRVSPFASTSTFFSVWWDAARHPDLCPNLKSF